MSENMSENKSENMSEKKNSKHPQKDTSKNPNKKKKPRSNRLFWLILVACVAVGLSVGLILSSVLKPKPEEMQYTQFLTAVDEGKVEEINFDGSDKITFTLKDDDKTYETDNPQKDGFKEEMLKEDITFNEIGTPFWVTLLGFLLPYIPFAILIIILLRTLPGFMGNRYKSSPAEQPDTTFDDVAGLEEIKADMKLIAEMVKDPELCKKMGARMTRGVLLEGEPGNGKTLFARALAGETKVNFYSANASEFIEMYAGLGASRVRKLFQEAKEHAPSVVFIDELDAIGGARNGDSDSAGREYTQCLNALLAAIDGFEAADGVLVIGATNRAEDLDPALVRPGRFDKQFVLPMPDCEAREAILRLHAKGKRFASDVDFAALAKETVGFSGAGLEALLNEAALLALSQKVDAITTQMISDAALQMRLKGHLKPTVENRNQKEQQSISYHEAGHAVATMALTDHEVRRVTVLPTTAGTGGLTMSVPPANQQLLSVADLRHEIQLLYAGRAAEYLLHHGDESAVSLGAAQDIQEATKLLQTLVTMTEKQGLIDYSGFGLFGQEELLHLCTTLSEELWQETVTLLQHHWSAVERIAKVLQEKDTILGEEARTLFATEQVE